MVLYRVMAWRGFYYAILFFGEKKINSLNIHTFWIVTHSSYHPSVTVRAFMFMSLLHALAPSLPHHRCSSYHVTLTSFQVLYPPTYLILRLAYLFLSLPPSLSLTFTQS